MTSQGAALKIQHTKGEAKLRGLQVIVTLENALASVLCM